MAIIFVSNVFEITFIVTVVSEIALCFGVVCQLLLSSVILSLNWLRCDAFSFPFDLCFVL